MPLIGNDDLVQIDLPAAGEWVKVKRRLSRGDEIAVQQALVRGSRVVAGSSETLMDAEGVIEAAEFATLDVAIKAWSFDAPISQMHIRALDGESIDVIKARMNELYPVPRTDDETKNSSAPLAAQSEAAATSPANSPG